MLPNEISHSTSRYLPESDDEPCPVEQACVERDNDTDKNTPGHEFSLGDESWRVTGAAFGEFSSEDASNEEINDGANTSEEDVI